MKPGLVQSLSNLQVRIISAFFIGLLFITAIFFIRPLFFILVITIAAIMLAEWYDMAHLKKNTRGAVPGLAVHFERKTDHHTNK